MNLEEKISGILPWFRNHAKQMAIPLAFTTALATATCGKSHRKVVGPDEQEPPKQEIVQLNPVITTAKTGEEGTVDLQDPETNKISILKIKDKETQQPLQNIGIACYNNKEENIQAVIAQDSLGVYFSNIAYFLPKTAKITEMPNLYEMLLEKDLSKPFVHFELEIPEYVPKDNKTFIGTTTLRDLHKFYEEHDTLFNNADILEFYFTVLGVKNHPLAVFATRLNEARSKFIENMATYTDIKNIILGFTGSEQDPDAWYLDVYKSNISSFGIVQHETNDKGLCTLKGRVIDKFTKKPLETIISIDSKKDTSDVNGNYMITFIPEGEHTISCLKDGFNTASLDTLIRAAKFPSFVSTKKNFELETIKLLERPSKIAFVSNHDGNCEIYVMNSDGTNQIRLTNNQDRDYYPAWSPDGTKIAFTSDYKIYVMNADGTNKINLTNNLSSGCISPAWSPDGTKIVFTSDYKIYVMNADGSDQMNLTSNLEENYEPAWSPDGTKIVFTSYRDGNPEVYVMNADGTGKIRLTNNRYRDDNPAWSPDGTKIAFTLHCNGTEVYVMNADGTNKINLTNNPTGDYGTSWSPDGTKIAFTSDRDGNQRIYVMNADGTGKRCLTTNVRDNFCPAWSPYLVK